MSNNNYSANYNWLPNAAHKKAVNVAPINTKPTPTSTNKSNASSYKAPARQKEVSYKDIKPTKCLSFLKNLFCKKPIERLEFSPKAWLKINAYINLIGDLEITGLGKVEKIEGKDIITDIIILKQIVDSIKCECEATAIPNFLNTLPIEERQLWILDWHSHVDMAVTPSLTDTNNYRTMFAIRLNNIFPVMIINKQQNIYCANYYGNDYYKNIPVSYSLGVTEEEIKTIYKECQKDIEEKVQERQVFYYAQSYNYPKSTSKTVYRDGKFVDDVYEVADDQWDDTDEYVYYQDEPDEMTDEQYQEYLDSLDDEEYEKVTGIPSFVK